MNNILIQSGISSNNLLLGPAANFLSALLKDSLHSTTNSTMYPSLTHQTKINGSGPLIVQIFQPSYHFLSQTNGSWAHHTELIYVCLFTHSCNKQGNSNKENFMQIYEYMYLCFHLSRLICKFLVSRCVNSSSFSKIHSSISFLEGFHVMSLLHHVAQNLQVPTMEPIVGLGFHTQGLKGFTNKYPICVNIFNIQGLNKVSLEMHMRITETKCLCIA
jgi:hypothetical protein